MKQVKDIQGNRDAVLDPSLREDLSEEVTLNRDISEVRT